MSNFAYDRGRALWSLVEPYRLHVLGGCCGTTDAHMRALAARMAGAA